MNATHYSDLGKNEIATLVPPSFLVLMTGASRATQNRAGTVTLSYTDGTKERARIPTLNLLDAPDWFDVVSAVQAKTRKK